MTISSNILYLKRYIYLFFTLIFLIFSNSSLGFEKIPEGVIPTLVPFTTRAGGEIYRVKGQTGASFTPNHESVFIHQPKSIKPPPIVIYIHGGRGLLDADEDRIKIFQEKGFVTISFDAFLINGFGSEDWVQRNLTNSGKQNLSGKIARGAFEYAISQKKWDTRNIFLYGQSNGAAAVLYLPSLVSDPSRIRGILSEGFSGIGYGLPQKLDIPTRFFYGQKDTWGAGDNKTIYQRKTTYWPRGNFWAGRGKNKFPKNLTVQGWVDIQKTSGKDVDIIIYENAGHSFHSQESKDGDIGNYGLYPSNQCRGVGGYFCYVGYLGANFSELKKYNKDIDNFISSNLIK
jgi:dienelactone hydrolase